MPTALLAGFECRLRTRPRLAAWLTFLAACAVLAGVHALIDARHRRAAAAEADVLARFEELWSMVNDCHLRTRREVEVLLNAGRPLAGRSTTRPADRVPPPLFAPPPLRGISTTGPATAPAAPAGGTSDHSTSFRATLHGSAIAPRYAGWTLYLHFVDGRLRGASSVAPRRVAYAGPPAEWHVAHSLRRAALLAGAVVWAGCLLTLPFNRPWRRQIGQVALACVIVVSIAWWLAPVRSWVPWRVRSNAPLLLGGAGALSLLVAVAPATRRRRRPDDHPACAGCGYDLTGNESGVCPECGRVTPQGLVDRWREQAELIEVAADGTRDAVDGDAWMLDAELPSADREYQEGSVQRSGWRVDETGVLTPIAQGSPPIAEVSTSVQE